MGIAIGLSPEPAGRPTSPWPHKQATDPGAEFSEALEGRGLNGGTQGASPRAPKARK